MVLAAAAATAAQPPSSAEKARFLEEARVAALNYSDVLPDFVCTEVVQRSVSDAGVWRNLDSLTLQLTYAGKKENYKVVLAGNKVSDQSMLSMSGVISSGEFGSMLRWIFEPSSGTEFHWEKASTVRKTPVWVYSYRVPQAGSHFLLAFESGDEARSMIVGFHGLLEIDRNTNLALHLTQAADDIPPGFAIQGSTTTIDYAYADVGGKQFLLPSQAETDMLYQPSRVEFERPTPP